MAGACSESTAPPTITGLRLLSGPAAHDTVDARPIEAIVLEVRDSAGGTVPQVPVFFESISVQCGSLTDCPIPSMLVMAVHHSGFSGGFSVATTADGRASALIKFGPIAGPGGIVVTVPDLGIADTIEFTIQPGAPAGVSASPLIRR